MIDADKTYAYVDEIASRPIMTVIFEDQTQVEELFNYLNLKKARGWRGRYARMRNAIVMALEPTVRALTQF
jgi:hypothetical protein